MTDKFDLIVDRIDDLKENTNTRLDSIDKNLAQHMRRTDILEKLHIDNQDRIKILEKPSLAKEYIYKHIIKIGVILGVVATILTVVIKFKEIF